MGRILLVLLLSGLAAGAPNRAIADNNLGLVHAGTAPLFTPPALYGAELHPAPLLHPPSAVTAAPVWRERNEWDKRRTEQWAEIEWRRQQWREAHGGDPIVVPVDNSVAGNRPSSSNF
ncbi:hypothetical protein SAMN04515620_15420 [Collimonas sp. OK607]|uniref:hypothetical protein n=1 Tax=Collimonas sp. OK607 TaxID=1798194 RepID=UPI0008ED5C9B|nr:hypothetical protein [Collimonas sp. OK607]SFB37079.1 hypothetical protein SAMN04515620_15420 [Collimonas sp. OK607]